MAKKKQGTKSTEAALSAKARSSEALAKQMAVTASRSMAQFDKLKKNVQQEHSVTRTLTVDMGAAALAHTFDQFSQFGVRALAVYSQRTAGTDGHFAKHVAIYSSAPQTVIGMLVYILELATRDTKTMRLSLGRDLASRSSNLLTNLGLANTLRAVRYYLAKSIDEEQEDNSEKQVLLNKIAELTKQVEGKK